MKVCSKCGIEKDLDCFLARKDRKCGINHRCKDCLNLDRRSKYNENKDCVKQRQKLYYEKNKEKYFEYGKKYREKLTEDRLKKDKEYRRKWYFENRDHVLNQRKDQKERINEWQREYEKKRDIEKRKANVILNLEIRKGNLKRPLKCNICTTDKYKIQGHHSDYSKPLEVLWVCTFCHAAIHKELKQRENNESNRVKEEASQYEV